jgi:hypothetical protein
MSKNNNQQKYKGKREPDYNKSKQPSSAPISNLDLFTGGKTPALALFYNLAYARVAGIVYANLEKNKGKKQKEQLAATVDEKTIQTAFERWLWNPTEKSDLIFPKLKDYLWKGYQNNKNSSGYTITDADKSLIISMLKKLSEIRNFFSHIYHDNAVMQVDDKLREAINRFHKAAYQSFIVEAPKMVEKYEADSQKRPFFSEHGGKWFFKQDGRIFFLSFFLTSGEMQRFLQQCKGYKRLDSNKHFLLHKVFRYYTHRDGATRQHYGHTENMMNDMSADEKFLTQNGQQAFKLISYLNDVPLYARDTRLLPLYLSERKLEYVEDYIAFCKKHDLFQDIFKIEKHYEKVKNENGYEVDRESHNHLTIKLLDKNFSFTESEEKRKARENNLQFDENAFDRSRSITMGDKNLAHYTKCINDPNTMPFVISKNTLHRLILDALRLGDNGKSLKSVLSGFIDERKALYRFWYDAAFKDREMELYKYDEDDQYLDNYYRFKLRSEYLTKEMGEWRAGKTWKEGFENKILKEAIELEYYHFYYAQERKIRKKDSFMYFAIRYLIDFQIVKKWRFMLEKFEIEEETRVVEQEIAGAKFKKVEKLMVNKRRVMFSNRIPDGWRLAIDDEEHIMVAFFDEKNTANIGVSNKATHKFSVGPKAMRALLMAHFDNKNLEDFFTPLMLEIDAIKQGKPKQNSPLITDNEMSYSFKVKAGTTSALKMKDLKEQANRNIEKQLLTLEKIINEDSEIKRWKRAEKNKFIMDCYTLFDWKYKNQDEFKFLRKDEYKQMSIYHYCLDRKKTNNWKYDKFKFLIEEAFFHTPKIVNEWLKDAKSFDDLLLLVAEGTKKRLMQLRSDMGNANIEIAKNALSKLGFHVQKEPKINQHLPFAIHPMLVIRKFYKEEYNNEIDNEKPGRFSKFSLSKKFKEANISLENKLISENYQVGKYLQITENEHLANTKTNVRHIKGEVDNEKIQDMVLARMVDKYLESCSANYQFVISGNTDWVVKSMRKTTINQIFDDAKYGRIELNIRFHQLDDFLLVEGKEVIAKAIHQVLERYQNDEKFQERNAEIQHTDRILQRGERDFLIPYEQVFKEIQRVYNESLRWATHLYEWERSVIALFGNSKLEALAQKTEGKAHINFAQICELANQKEDKLAFLNKLRNHIFHVKIPSDFTYRELKNSEKYQWLRTLLRYDDREIAEKYTKVKNVNTKKS